MNMQCPLQCMAALDTIPPENVCTHHKSVQYGTARSPSISKTSIWHSDSAVQNYQFNVQQTLPNFPNKTVNAVMFTRKMCVQSSWQHLQLHATVFQMYTYSTSNVTTWLIKKRWHDLWSDPCIFTRSIWQSLLFTQRKTAVTKKTVSDNRLSGIQSSSICKRKYFLHPIAKNYSVLKSLTLTKIIQASKKLITGSYIIHGAFTWLLYMLYIGNQITSTQCKLWHKAMCINILWTKFTN